MNQDSNNKNENALRNLSKENCLQIAEIAGAQSFILISCESKLPCDGVVNGDGCNEGHKYGFTVYKIDHQHTVSTLEMALEKIMREGLGNHSV